MSFFFFSPCLNKALVAAVAAAALRFLLTFTFSRQLGSISIHPAWCYWLSDKNISLSLNSPPSCVPLELLRWGMIGSSDAKRSALFTKLAATSSGCCLLICQCAQPGFALVLVCVFDLFIFLYPPRIGICAVCFVR